MIRKLLQDYILTGKNISIKDARKNNIPIGVGEIFLFPTYILITLLIRVIMGYKTKMIKEIILFLGYFFIWVSQIKHPMKPGKMYYLCPMDEKERRAYLKNAWLFRGCLHSLVVMITCLILYFLCKVNRYVVLYIMIDGILFGFLCNVRDIKKDRIREAFLKPALFLSAYVQFALPSAGLGKGDYFFIAFSFAFLLLVELPLFVWLIKNVKNDMMAIASCEENLYKC